MKQFLAISILFAYVISTNPASMELTKIPLLFEHYQEHKALEPRISFKDFLYIHYGKKENKYGDTERDKQMPFKSSTQVGGNFICVILPTSELIIHSKIEYQQPADKKVELSTSYASRYLSSIWQPPQLF